MILGRGTARSDEEIIADYYRCLEQVGHITGATILKRVREAGLNMRRRIGKPIHEWSDDEIITLYDHRSNATWVSYNVFLSFLLFRGYRRASVHLLVTVPINLTTQWGPAVAPYRERLERTTRELGYSEKTPSPLSLLLWLLTFCQKPLEEITRADFEAFRTAHDAWFRGTGRRPSNKGGAPQPDPRLFRLENYLVHWKIMPLTYRPLRYEQHLARLRQPAFQAAYLDFCKWLEVRFKQATVDHVRHELIIFFEWLEEHHPHVSRLADVTRAIGLDFAHYLRQQGEAGKYGIIYQHSIYARVNQLFDFALREWPDLAPQRNPLPGKDLPRKPDMVPRYLNDQEIRTILQYGEREATLLERTIVVTLLHTGIRSCEFAALKATDIVQVGGIWKLHIHEGKGLKDRVIPLTARCLQVLQEWQEHGWECANEFLFTHFGRPWKNSKPVSSRVWELGRKLGIAGLTPHRFRHTFAVALLNYGIRESALQKLMGHAEIDMTLEYARILDKSVEQGFTEAIERMEEGAQSWVPNFFVQDDYSLFVEANAVSWIRLPLGYCRRNPKLHCESDVKCLLCERFVVGKEDLPRLRQMHDRFLSLGLGLKADVVAAQIQRLELPSAGGPQGFIPIQAISTTKKC